MGHFLKLAASLAVIAGLAAAGIHFLHRHGISLGICPCRCEAEHPPEEPQASESNEAS